MGVDQGQTIPRKASMSGGKHDSISLAQHNMNFGRSILSP